MAVMTLSALVQKFFTDRLYSQMEASPHTVASYRDTFRLLLKFAGEKTGKSPMVLSIDDLNAEMIGVFLDDIENVRENSARSRNTRLAAIRSFFRFVADSPRAWSSVETRIQMPTGFCFSMVADLVNEISELVFRCERGFTKGYGG